MLANHLEGFNSLLTTRKNRSMNSLYINIDIQNRLTHDQTVTVLGASLGANGCRKSQKPGFTWVYQ